MKQKILILCVFPIAILTSSQTKVSPEKRFAESLAVSGKNNLIELENGTLQISNTGSLQILADGSLTAKGKITNLGNGDNFILESDGNLIQIDNISNVGSVKVERMVNGLRYNPGTAVDYVYWSSPVAGQKTKGAGGFSPATPNNSFLYYRESNDYFYETGDLTFTPGRGYAVQSETNKGSSPFNRLFEFKGTPNNGDIGFPLAFTNAAHGYNLVGNPYPSNISFEQLYAANSNLIWNTAYFWTNNVYTPSQMSQNYGGNNYAVYNGTGGNSANKVAGGTGNNVIPNGVIKVGQGFIVQAKMLGTLDFKNNYGLNHELRTGSAAPFYSKGVSEKNRFWIKLIAPTKLENSQLIGYVEGATDDFEQDYDAEAFDNYSDLFYSAIPGKKLLIQGKGQAFTTEDKIILGANFFQNGTYTIALENAEGIFKGIQDIYLKDKQEGIITNLSKGSYNFNTIKGDNALRFEIIYNPETLLATEGTEKESLLVYRDGSDFVIKSPSKKITEVEVYDASGRLQFTQKPNQTLVHIPAEQLIRGVYVLKITQEGKITTKKIIR